MSPEAKPRICVTCKVGEMKPGRKVTTVTIDGREASGEVPIQACSNCGEVYWNGPAMEKLERQALAHES